MKWLIPLALLALTACSDGAPQVSVATQIAGGDLVYAAPLLATATRDFFGGGSGGGSGGLGGGLGSGLGGGVFGNLDGVVMRGAPPAIASVTVTRADPLAGLVLRSQLGVEYAQLDATLPNGLGVLTDPMQVAMWQRALRAQVTAGQSLALNGGWRFDFAAGVGWVQYIADGHIRSALIDLRPSTAGGVPYGILDAGLTPARGPGLTAGLLLYPYGRAELRLGLSQAF